MNAATKLKWANLLTAIVAILAVLQTFLTTPPFPVEWVFTMGAIVTYLTLALTTWKQYLSPDVSGSGVTVTIWIAVIATIGGLADLINIFHIPEQTSQYIRWGITVIVAILNVLSKQIFPSFMQKQRMTYLKNEK